MAFEHYIRAGNQRLRCGYTTGTCAALAALGAAELLLTGRVPDTITVVTPKGLTVSVASEICRTEGNTAYCALRKDAGDDKDVTDGALIGAYVERAPTPGVTIDGGAGVGRVTKPGLNQPVGAAAINRVPRQMITEAVLSACDEAGYDGGLAVTITVENGEELAAKTFNPQLGIVGGISILGTSGIVEPMSVQAVVDTISLEMGQGRAQGAAHVVLVPGNLGLDFLKSQGLPPTHVPVVKCSNYIGEALDEAAVLGFQSVLLVGHIGKLVKLAGGIMNTHSSAADCRRELFCCYAALCGASRTLCKELMGAATADGCIAILEKAGLREQVLQSLTQAVDSHLERRAGGAYQVGAILFSQEHGPLGQTSQAAKIMEGWT